MVAIAPLRALRFDPGRADLARVTSPPHDCIPPALRGELAKEGHSIVHVVLPAEAPGDGEGPGPPSKFDRARALLAAWEADGTLVRDGGPALYLLESTHRPDGEPVTMRALLCRMALDPSYTQVRPHELILPRKKRERLLLRQATGCDTEPIWLLYRDPRGWVEEILSSNAFEEMARCTDEEGIEHRLWRVDRPEAVGEVVAQFEDRTVVIADGHHRYQTALDHAAQTGRPEHASILVALVRDNDPGVRVVATHRVVHGVGWTGSEAVRRASGGWDARRLAWDARSGAAGLLMGLSTGVVLMGRDGAGLAAWHLQPREVSPDALAVVQVHEILLRDSWGFDPAQPERHLRFTRDAGEAVAQVAAGGADLALLLPPERVEAVLDAAAHGRLMPQKATYFIPKIRSGLVLGPLDEPPPRPWREAAGDPGQAKWWRPPL